MSSRPLAQRLAENPPCPKCKIKARVKKCGVLKRNCGPVAIFRCGPCAINFIDPAKRVLPGSRLDTSLQEEAVAMRRQGLSFREIGERLAITGPRAFQLCVCRYRRLWIPGQPAVDGLLEIKLRPQDFSTLQQMFSAGGRSASTLDVFAGELLEAQCADFRCRKIDSSPLGPEKAPMVEATWNHRQKISPQVAQTIRQIAAENPELRYGELGHRFHVAPATIARILRGDAHAE